MRKGIERYCLLSFGILICIPVIMVVFGSLKSGNELTSSLAPILADGSGDMRWSLFPQYPTLKNYIQLLFETPQFFTVFWNSVKIVVSILIRQLFIAAPAAWAFAKFQIPHKKILFTGYVILMLMPFQVTMLPSYLVLNQLGLINTHASIILPAVFSTFPVFLMYRGFCEIPNEMIEAARTDGAGTWRIFFSIGIPLGSNGILSAMVLGFLEYWNLIEQPLAFLKDKTLWPLSLYLPEIGVAQAGIAFAASVITLIPAVFVFILGQDYLEKGIAASGIKE